MASDDIHPLVKQAADRFEREKRRWDQYVSMWQDAYDYALPARDRFNQTPGSTSEGSKRGIELFDMTAPVSVGEFASRLHAGIMPPFVKWFELKAGPEVPDEKAEKLNAELEKVTQYIFEVLRDSNLDSQAHEAFIDIAIGTASLLVEDGPTADKPLVFRAVPHTHCVLGRGPNGDQDAHFRVETVQPGDLPVRFPEARLPDDIQQQIKNGDQKEIEIMHATWRDWSVKGTDSYVYVCWIRSQKTLLLQHRYEGAGSNPWITFRWQKAAGELYGRGPLLSVMPAIKTANYVVRLTLENAEMAIAGMYNADDDGVVNPQNIKLAPGTIIPRAPGSKGLEPIVSAGRFDVANMELQQLRADIKKGLYDEMLGPPEGTPMSATEVRERQADMARRIGSPFMRIWTEFAEPLIQRVVFLLARQGRIQLPKVNGREVKIVAVSPLARAQEQEDVRNLDVYLEMLAARFGPQMLSAVVKPTAAASFIGKKLGIPANLVRGEKEAEAFLTRLQQIATMDASQQQQQPPGYR